MCDQEKSALVSVRQLNDAGVFLLHENAYRQSFDTFQDALHVLHIDDLSASSMVKESNERIDCLEPFPRAPSIRYVSLSLDEIESDDIEAVLGKLEADADGECCLAILFDDKMTSSIAFDLATAIVQYNIGVAYQAYAFALKRKKKYDASYVQSQLAKRLLEASESLLSQMAAEVSSEAGGLEGESLRMIFFVHLLVLLGVHKQVSREDEVLVTDKLYTLHSRLTSGLETLENEVEMSVAQQKALNRRSQLSQLFTAATSSRNLDCSRHSGVSLTSF